MCYSFCVSFRTKGADMKVDAAPKLSNDKFTAWLIEHVADWKNALELAKRVTSYLPWGKEKYKAPEGYAPEVWWSLLLLSRNLQEIDPQLKSASGEPFVLSFTVEVQALLHRIDLMCGVTTVSLQSPNQKSALGKLHRKYLQRSLLEEAISSSQMEGASTTRAVARKMLLEDRAPKDVSERMIFNNYKTIKMLEAWKDEPLSESLLFKIHRSLTFDTLEEEKQGRYRVAADGPITVSKGFETVFVPPPVETLPERMKCLIAFANQSHEQGNVFLHPVLKAILLHTLLAYEHPFCDGNGRTARALFSWFLLREGYWQTSYVSLSRALAKNRKAYDAAYLAMETCHFDTTYNVLVNLKAFKDALESLHAHLNEQIEDATRMHASFGDLFNARQFDLLDHSLRHEGYLYTVAEHARWHQTTLNTARADLLDLKKKGYLKLSYKGRLQEFRSTGLFAQQASDKKL